MRIHREGYRSLFVVGLALLLFNITLTALSPSLLVLALPLSVLIWGFFAQFFRNPPRRIPPPQADTILSPADGTVVAIETVTESEYFHDQRLKISIYMSALNVHLNRAPLSGRVTYARYHAGKYLVAFHPKSSELNERQTVVIADEQGREVLVRQIAGLLARRIVCYLREGATTQAGDELGFIKFGSRCDLFLPVDSKACVQHGQRVRGGETILAQF